MDVQSETEVKKVAIVGPECTGKSTLAEFLASHYHTAFVPEYARGYIDNLVRPYEKEDLTTIAHGQLRLEEVWGTDAERVLVCDTDLLVIKIWSDVKFGTCAPEIADAFQENVADLYLLTYIDVPWEDDPQREDPDRREELYDIYLKEVSNLNAPFVEVKGDFEHRKQTAIEAIDRLLA